MKKESKARSREETVVTLLREDGGPYATVLGCSASGPKTEPKFPGIIISPLSHSLMKINLCEIGPFLMVVY